jgi:hypothetical protein
MHSELNAERGDATNDIEMTPETEVADVITDEDLEKMGKHGYPTFMTGGWGPACSCNHCLTD